MIAGMDAVILFLYFGENLEYAFSMLTKVLTKTLHSDEVQIFVMKGDVCWDVHEDFELLPKIETTKIRTLWFYKQELVNFLLAEDVSEEMYTAYTLDLLERSKSNS